ncbi:hypothetical protein [Candidatus Tisiphia endosymbiont of Oplodontha viridula]|uniref:hypothetical protein n=1 Tax=Candidatus Tisiphia endosymbiont of Oplodontha viridula TaxID=3077925 RepID=UPI0035C8A13A
MSKKKSNDLSKKIQNIDEKFEKTLGELDKKLFESEVVTGMINDSLDRMGGSVSSSEVDKLMEEIQSEVNLDNKYAELGKRKDREIEDRLKALKDSRPKEETLKNSATPTVEGPIPTVDDLRETLKKLKEDEKKILQSTKPIGKVAPRPRNNSPRNNNLAANSRRVQEQKPSKPPKINNNNRRHDVPKENAILDDIKPEKSWFAKIIDKVVDIVKELLNNSQNQDTPSPKQQDLQEFRQKRQEILAPVIQAQKKAKLLKEEQKVSREVSKAKKLRNSFAKHDNNKPLRSSTSSIISPPSTPPVKPPVNKNDRGGR